MGQVICGVDKNGRVYPLGVKYDEGTGLASLAISRGAGKNTFTELYEGQQIDVAIIEPSATQKLCIASIFSCADASKGTISLDFATSETKVYRHYCSRYQVSQSSDMHLEGALGEDLTLNTDELIEGFFITVNYRLVS